jgi:hypothetical protein
MVAESESVPGAMANAITGRPVDSGVGAGKIPHFGLGIGTNRPDRSGGMGPGGFQLGKTLVPPGRCSQKGAATPRASDF